MAFNPKGKGYDYKSAIKAGMRHKAHGRTSPANITQHWGSVAPATRKETMTGNLPKGSYKVLKGEKHETMWKAKQAEQKRGARLVKRGGGAQNTTNKVRTYSIPTIHMGKRR
jgi:hypothetical protein